MKTTLKTQARQIRLPLDLWDRLAELATRVGKSRAELIREQLMNFVRREDKKSSLRKVVEESHDG